MRAAVRSIMSFDVDLEVWGPPDVDFGVMVRVLAGPEDDLGEESFDLVVCTGGWLAASAARSGIVDARHHLVVNRFDWSAIRVYLEDRVRACEGKDWSEVANKLSRLGYWEFEDYRA